MRWSNVALPCQIWWSSLSQLPAGWYPYSSVGKWDVIIKSKLVQKIELRKYCLYYSAFTKVSVLKRFIWSLIFVGPSELSVNRRCPWLKVRLYAITSDQRSDEGRPLMDSTDLRVQWFAQLLIIALAFHGYFISNILKNLKKRVKLNWDTWAFRLNSTSRRSWCDRKSSNFSF